MRWVGEEGDWRPWRSWAGSWTSEYDCALPTITNPVVRLIALIGNGKTYVQRLQPLCDTLRKKNTSPKVSNYLARWLTLVLKL